MIGRTLETAGMFPELLAVAEPPEAEGDTVPYRNLHIEVLFGVDPPSGWSNFISLIQGVPGIVIPPLALAMVDPIPYYSGQGGLRVLYALYHDGTRQAAYQYAIKKKGWGGILLLPFAWLNLFTDDLKDGLRATTLQFLINAHRDGNL